MALNYLNKPYYVHPFGEGISSEEDLPSCISTGMTGEVSWANTGNKPIRAMSDGSLTWVCESSLIKKSEESEPEEGKKIFLILSINHPVLGDIYCVYKDLTNLENSIWQSLHISSDNKIEDLKNGGARDITIQVKQGMVLGTGGSDTRIQFVKTYSYDATTFVFAFSEIEIDSITNSSYKTPIGLEDSKDYGLLVQRGAPVYLRGSSGTHYNKNGDEFIGELKEAAKKLKRYKNDINYNYKQPIVDLYNYMIDFGLCSGAACCVLASGYHENMINCIKGNTVSWGIAKASNNDPGYDCGIWAFHSGGSAYHDKVLGMIFTNPADWGLTSEQISTGDAYIQAMYITAICQQWDQLKTNGKSRYPMYVRKSTKSIVNQAGQTICPTVDIQKKYVSDFNAFFDDYNDLELGALLFERLFEGSKMALSSLQNRSAMALLLGYVLAGIDYTGLFS